jgi:hypothetical protein
MHMPLDLIHDSMVIIDIDVMAGGNADQPRTHTLRLGDARAGADAERLCFIARGDGEARIRHDRGDDDRLPPQRRVVLLLDAGEIAVEVKKQPFEPSVIRPAKGRHRIAFPRMSY